MPDTERAVNIGILSTAKIGLKSVIPAMKQSKYARPVAIGSRTKERAEQAASESGIARAYGSYEAVLEDPEVEAVYIPTANHLHAEWVVRAAEAGKHVLCEKPLAVNLDEALRMRDACRKARVLLMDAFMYRHHPQHARVREIMASGELGEVRQIRAAFTFNLTVPPEENIRLRPDTAGGSLMDVGCYCVNAARLLFGAEPERVTGFADETEGIGVETQFSGILNFGQGKSAMFNSSFRQARHHAYVVAGSEGHLTALTAFVPGEADTVLRIQTGGGVRDETIPGVNQYALEADHFCKAILDGGPLPPPAEDGVANMAVLDALYRSAREGRAVSLERA